MLPKPTVRALCCALLVAALAGCRGGEPPASSLEVAAHGAHSAEVSSDGQRVVIGSLTQGGSLWTLDPDERRFNWNHRADAPSSITVLAFSPDGAYALTGEGDTLVLWNAGQGSALGYFRAPSSVITAALGPDGRYALLGLQEQGGVVFDARAGGVVRTLPHEGRVHSVAMDHSGTRALTGSADRTARLWDLDSGKELQRWTHKTDVRLVALSGDGSRALSVSKYDRATVWDTSSGQAVTDLPTWSTRIVRGETFTAARFSGDGTRLLTGTTDGRVQSWEVSPVRELGAWALPRRAQRKQAGGYLLAVGFSAEEGILLGISADGFIHRLRTVPAAR